MLRTPKDFNFKTYVSGSRYKHWFEHRLTEYCDVLSNKVNEHWPELLDQLYPNNNDEKREQLLVSIENEDREVDQIKLAKLLTLFLSYSNQTDHIEIDLTPSIVQIKSQQSRHSSYYQAAKFTVDQIAKNFSKVVNQSNGGERNEWGNNKDKLSGLIIFSFIYYCRIHNLSHLKYVLSTQLAINFNDKSQPLTIKISNNFNLFLGPITELLILIYLKKYSQNNTANIFQLFSHSPNSNTIFKLIKKAIPLPETIKENITLTKLLDWVNYAHEVDYLSPLYAQILRQSNFTSSLKEPSNDNKVHDNKLHLNKAISPDKRSSLYQNLKLFCTIGGAKNNTKKRLTYIQSINFLTESKAIQTDTQEDISFISLEMAICDYATNLLSKETGKADVSRASKKIKCLMTIIPHLETCENYEIVGFNDLNEVDFLDLYETVLNFSNKSQRNNLSKELPSFHQFCVKTYHCHKIDSDFFKTYKTILSSTIRAVLISPQEYALIKSYLLEPSNFKSERTRMMLLSILIIAYRLGLRRFEVTNLTNFDLQLVADEIIIQQHNQPLKTNNAERILPTQLLLNSEIRVIKGWLQLRKNEVTDSTKEFWLFTPNKSPTTSIKYSQSTDALVKIIRKVINRTVTFHWLRHSAANNFILSLETITKDKYDLLIKLLPEFESTELSKEHMIQIASCLLGQPAHKDVVDDNYSMIQLSRIMGHSSPYITMHFYIHTIDVILEFYDRPILKITNKSIEFLLNIGKTTRVKYMEKYLMDIQNITIEDIQHISRIIKYNNLA